MKVKVLLVVLIVFYKINLNAAEAGMPQLDPTYWFSQAFWLILIFSLLYISIAKFFIPKIKAIREYKSRRTLLKHQGK